jgi:hypothetical protein
MLSPRAVPLFASLVLGLLLLAAPSAAASSAFGGVITDATSGKPIADARVTLYRVRTWTARTSPAQNSTPNTCESNASKPSNAAWTQPAPTNMGQEVDPAAGQISPAKNPLLTDAHGRYSWTVPAGCWFVLVTNPPDYYPVTSPVVGVPTAVDDLNVAMTNSSSDGGGSGGNDVGSNGTNSPPGTSTDQPTSSNPTASSCVVPKLIGRSLKSAKRALAKAHCRVGRISKRRVKHRGKGKRVKAGTVIAQALRPGLTRRTGSRVAITVAK